MSDTHKEIHVHARIWDDDKLAEDLLARIEKVAEEFRAQHGVFCETWATRRDVQNTFEVGGR